MRILKEELGYEVDHVVVDSRSWVPQKRKRIFIAGFQNPVGFSFDDFEPPDPEQGPRLSNILDPEDAVDAKYTLTPHLWKYLKDYKKKHRARGNGFGYDVFGPSDIARTLSARYYKDGSEILIDRGRGRRPRRLTPRECARLMGFDQPRRPEWADSSIRHTGIQAIRQCRRRSGGNGCGFVYAAFHPLRRIQGANGTVRRWCRF